jgi:hypothetical protein
VLDKRVFLRELGMLADRFGRTVSEPVMLRYFEILAGALSTADFERAAYQIFREDQFWPAPARFLDAARGGNPKDLAAAEWERLVSACAAGQTDVAFLSPAGVAGMRAAGGWRAIAFAEGESRQAALRRAFTSAWLDASGTAPDGRALPAPEIEMVLS